MVITYQGLQCFKVQFGDTVLAFDPISKSSKSKATSFGADITLISVNNPDMNGKDPLFKMGQIRWYKKPTAGNIYLISLDPSLGTGGDYSGIQVFELPTLKQVAEWQHNITPIQQQVKIFRDILKFIESYSFDCSEGILAPLIATASCPAHSPPPSRASVYTDQATA